MATTTEVVNAIYNDLSTDATLSASIKKFFKGNLDMSQPIFPSLGIGEVGYDNEAETCGRRGFDVRTYTIQLYVVTQSLAADTAYSDLLDIIEKIHSAVRVNDFSQVFREPVDITSVETDTAADKAGFIWAARIAMEGKVRVQRNA